MNDMLFGSILYLSGVFISAIAQLLLKKSASKKATVNIFTLVEKCFPKLYAKYQTSQGKLCKFIRGKQKLLIQYLNPFTIGSYAVFVTAMCLTFFAFKGKGTDKEGLDLSMISILATSEYIIVAVLSRIFMKERISVQKAIGLCVIVVGAAVYILGK